MAEFEDSALMSDLFIGKESAFKEIYARYYEKLYFFCFGIVGNTQDVEDIVIITLQRLFDRHGDFRTLAQVQTWLFLTARNQCIDALRRRKRVQIQNEQAIDFLSGDVENQAINDELDTMFLDKILDLIEDLPPQSRQVIRLRYLEGMKYREIGERLNISPRTVENLLRYALNRLRNVLTSKNLAIILFLHGILYFLIVIETLNFL